MKKNTALKLIALPLFILGLNACSLHSGRYQQKNDSHPDRLPLASELDDATPRFEPHSRQGNKSQYTVLGKQYRVMPSAENFTQTGEASWYGKKFHGHLTSNGEIYNMYSMSAAHKNLPLPTYVKVTNLANNKSVIVRVNDRGPFHQSRIIDLSYSAAYKLDMLKTGTATVKLEAITQFPYRPGEVSVATEKAIKTANAAPRENFVEKKSELAPQKAEPEVKPLPAPLKQYYIQVFATSKEQVALNTKKAIETRFQTSVKTPLAEGIYKVRVGPLSNVDDSKTLLNRLKENGYPNAYLIN